MLLSTALSKKNKATVRYISVDNYSGINNHQLAEEIYTFTALKELRISGKFNVLSPQIAHFKKLQHLSIASDTLKELPEEIGLLKDLVHLSISGENLTQLPKSIYKLKNLRHLHLSNLPRITVLPAILSELPKLECISIDSGNISNLTALNTGFEALKILSISSTPLNEQAVLPIFKLKKLINLSLIKSQLRVIPSEVINLKNLVSLVLSGNKLVEIPVFIAQLSALKILNFEANQITSFPAFLSKMPPFERIGWKDNLFGKYDKALVQFPITVTNPYKKVLASSKYCSFIEQVCNQKFSAIALELFFKIQSKQPLEKGLFKRADFIEILSFENKNFRTSVINSLLDYEKEASNLSALNSDSALFVLGKTALAKSDIRRVLKAEGITYQTKVNPSTTHLLVGSIGIKNHGLLANPAYTLVRQQCFQHYINTLTKPYLLDEENKGNLAQISSLLLSTNLENQNIGLELLKGGGTPKELLTELFIIFKFSEDKKMTAKAKNLLIANAPTKILEKLNLRINLRIIKEAYNTSNKLEQLTEGSSLEVWKMAQYAYHYKPNVWAAKIPLGLKNAPRSIAALFLFNTVQQQVERDRYTVEPNLLPYIKLLYQSCSFLKELKFNRVAKNIDGISALSKLKRLNFYFIENAIFPTDLYLVPNLEAIEFIETSTKDWSILLNQLALIPSLKKVSLWSSMKAGLHPDVAKLQSVEYFSCFNIPLQKESVEIFAALPHLTTLDLSNTSTNLDERYLSLKRIQKLCFHNTIHYTVTPRISELTALRTLILKGGPRLPNNIPPMPLLEELYIKTDYTALPIQFEQIKNLTNLKRLTILGNVENLKTMLPHFSKLEYLELYYNKIELSGLIEALKQLPSLKKFHRYLSTQDLKTLKNALPHLEVQIS